jgi:hypothetical protein
LTASRRKSSKRTFDFEACALFRRLDDSSPDNSSPKANIGPT